MKAARISILFLLFLCNVLPAQERANPFEIISADAEPIIAKDTVEQTLLPNTGNPFEIVATPAEKRTSTKKQSKTKKNTKQSSDQFLFFVILFMLLLLAVLITLFRNLVQRTYRAVINDNMMTQLYREREGGSGFTFTILYLMFIINAGIFIYLVSRVFQFNQGGSNFQWLLNCIWSFGALILFRHMILNLIGTIFPVSKETKLYSFTIIIFGIILGLFLVPVNLFIAFGPTEMVPVLIKIVFGIIVGVYLFRSLRGLFIANKFVVFHKFHFLLYICTVEIAPILIITKLFLRDVL